MKKNLISLSSLLLVISLLAGAANATGDANNTNESASPDEVNNNANDTIYPNLTSSDNGISSGNETSSGNVNLPETEVLPESSTDTIVPASVKNLKVVDAPGETQWSFIEDYPALYVSWDANTEDYLAAVPYDIFISDFAPKSLGEMEKIKSTSDTSTYIEKYGEKPLVYGKNYWVAVIARDNAGNYADCFAICGPVQTYEDMTIKLDKGWNMKSVPKRLIASNACTECVFGKDSIVLYWNGECWEFPEVIEPCKGYWVYSPIACENNVKFKPMSSDSSAPDVPASLCLAPGWQMIGHTSMYPSTWSSTLASLKDVFTDYKFSNLITYSHNEGWGGIIPEQGLIDMLTGDGSTISGGDFINGTDSCPVGALQFQGVMVPGQGYWVFMKKEGTYASIENVYNYQDYFASK